MFRDYEERKDWEKADRICSLSLQKECDLLRAYRRSIGHVNASTLQNLKQEWLIAEKQHNENIQTWWDSLLAPWLRSEKKRDYEHAHNCTLCERTFYSSYRATVYCGYWCMYTTYKRKKVERYLKTLERKCPGCAIEFTAKDRRMDFCSNACRQRAYRKRKKSVTQQRPHTSAHS